MPTPWTPTHAPEAIPPGALRPSERAPRWHDRRRGGETRLRRAAEALLLLTNNTESACSARSLAQAAAPSTTARQTAIARTRAGFNGPPQTTRSPPPPPPWRSPPSKQDGYVNAPRPRKHKEEREKAAKKIFRDCQSSLRNSFAYII